MSASPTSEPESDFVCDCELEMRSACAGEPFYREHEDKRYCVLHFPGKEKSADFQQALQRKLENEDFDFRAVWFPDELSFENFEFSTKANFDYATFSAETSFSSATFSAETSFSSATFSAAADFSHATFSWGADFSFVTFSAEAYLNSATFSEAAYFSGATFRAVGYFSAAKFRAMVRISATFSAEADFSFATFSEGAHFSSATFSAEADFSFATFNAEVDFNSATFADHVRFQGSEMTHVFRETSSLDLQFARLENPDHVSFHTLSLRPHWFLNIDARKFGFTNVNWGRLGINEEITGLENSRISMIPILSDLPLLAIACRNLAVNAEENHRYEEASKFRYMAMEARRLESWRGLAPWRLSWWYWLASGYGERVLKAFVVLLGIWFLTGLLYTRVGFARWEPKLASETDVATARRDDGGAPLKLSRALTYSVGVMTFQKPEPRPATTAAQTVVLLETILGPVQAALLALAIRRKFMR
jgi:pentapeptide repeat protein